MNQFPDHLSPIFLKETDSTINVQQEKLIESSQQILNKPNKLRQPFQMLKKFFTGKSSNNKTVENNSECIFGKNNDTGEQIADIEPRSVKIKYFKYNASYKKAIRKSEPLMGSYQLLQPLPLTINYHQKDFTDDFTNKQKIKEFEKNFGVKLERRNNKVMVS